MVRQERDILEDAVGVLAEQAADSDRKMLRLELLQVKADLERELERLVLDCFKCGQTVHYVAGLGVTAGHWAHREPAPHGEPAV